MKCAALLKIVEKKKATEKIRQEKIDAVFRGHLTCSAGFRVLTQVLVAVGI